LFDTEGKSGGGPPHSKTLARSGDAGMSRSVVECACPWRFEGQKLAGGSEMGKAEIGKCEAVAAIHNLGFIGKSKMAENHAASSGQGRRMFSRFSSQPLTTAIPLIQTNQPWLVRAGEESGEGES